ncbi:MAG: ABC transporter permease [Nocardiopsaceae bacterium]|nr:ABC transporter permease [Nocardiopsaceae bacterium]
MTNRGRLSAPGTLLGQGGPAAPDAAATVATKKQATSRTNELVPPGSLSALAGSYGLRPSAARPPVFTYLRQLWQRRHFIIGFATARTIAMYTEAKLGQLWQVLTPLLNAAVYFLIFGELLHTNRGVPQFIPFLVTGVFVFNFTQRSVITASKVMRDSLPLIRALYFPRACLPLGYVIIELQQLLLAFSVLIIIVLASGEPLTWYWLLALPALALQTAFNIGTGLLLARWGAGFDDVSQLLPFIVRTWLYMSGIMFSISALSLLSGGVLKDHPTLAYLMQINPAAVFITLIRNAVLASARLSFPGSAPYNGHLCAVYRFQGDNHHYLQHNPGALYYSAHCHPIISTPQLWMYGAGWALAALLIGFVVFWRAETRYGRG